MIREIVIYGDPVLRTKGAPVKQVDDEVRALADDMLETMYDAHGVGLAAQQIGVPLQLCVLDVRGVEERPSTMEIDGCEVPVDSQMPLVLLNPRIEPGSEREPGVEGCLSFPDITADIVRAIRVRLEATDLEGQPVRFEATGLLARALQHEVDHLHGVLFIDRMQSATRALLTGKLRRLREG
jgi:peptide deformylase